MCRGPEERESERYCGRLCADVFGRVGREEEGEGAWRCDLWQIPVGTAVELP